MHIIPLISIACVVLRDADKIRILVTYLVSNALAHSNTGYYLLPIVTPYANESAATKRLCASTEIAIFCLLLRAISQGRRADSCSLLMRQCDSRMAIIFRDLCSLQGDDMNQLQFSIAPVSQLVSPFIVCADGVHALMRDCSGCNGGGDITALLNYCGSRR